MYSTEGIEKADALVSRHVPLVKRIAYHLIGRLPSTVLVDDLIQAGMLGLLDAANQYDKSQGASFETYATIRIRGAMLDELRRNDWTPKSVHRKARQVAEAIRQVEVETGRQASDQEVAAVMELSLDEYYQILKEASVSKVLSIEELGGDADALGPPPDAAAALPPEQLQREQFGRHLAEAITTLPEREQLILSLYYDQELNLREIGAVLKVSESRVSQLMSQAHARLRARLSDWTSD